MTNHNLFVNHVNQRQSTEKLWKSLINSIILFKFSLNLSLESVNHVYLPGLMISSCHVKIIFVYTFPGNQGHNAFNRERPSVNKIAVKQVLVIWTRVAIQLKDVQHVIKLSMNITANCKLLLILNALINKRLIFFTYVLAFLYQLKSVSLVKTLLVFVVFHKLNNPE